MTNEDGQRSVRASAAAREAQRQAARQARGADALRANLKRRKDQARGRAVATDHISPEPTPDDG